MNTTGTLFKVTLYGESHQPAIGAVIEGVPPGLAIDETLIAKELMRRNPKAVGTTPRKEADQFEITSGVLNGRATGAPVHLTIPNTNTKSKDYESLKHHPRPGHADFVANEKYGGFQDFRGGGQFSGRLTAPLVAAGVIAKAMLPMAFSHRLVQLGSLTDMDQMDAYLQTIADEGDSVGGIIELNVTNMPIGLGQPIFQKLDSEIARILFSVPAVKGVQLGTAFDGASMKGSEFNDALVDESGKTQTNHSGGVSGGLSNGNPLRVRAFVKPTSSIKKPQETYHNKEKERKTLKVEGRHDVAIARRAGVVLENMLALVLADLYLQNHAHNPINSK